MLFNKGKQRITPTSTSTVVFTGGLNEELSNLELNSGELIDCQNYMEVDGSVSGYVSFPGYERFDGRPLASSVSLNVNPSTGEIIDDINREAARTLIQAIPGSGTTRGVAIYAGKVYGWRDNTLATAKAIYVESAAGWSLITSTTMNPGGLVVPITGRFSLYPAGSPNSECLFWVDSVSKLHVYNSTTVSEITHASLPAASYPTHLGIWNNRMFLAYPGGHVFFSKIGDPSEYDATLGAGEIYLGESVTAFEVTNQGDLIFFCKDSIFSLVDTTTSIGDFQFNMTTFSRGSGAISGTVKRMLGTIFFADDRGITTLENSAAYGDLSSKTISKKVNKTYLTNKAKISQAVINRQYNQYILFFNEGASYATALLLSFSSRKLKGCFKLRLNHPVYCVAEGKDDNRDSEIYFGSGGGYIYKMYSGTSFDGSPIPTWFQSTYYHYGSPTRWKHFRGLTLEVEAEGGTEIDYRCYFDYADSSFPSTETTTKTYDRVGSVWGSGVWGTFIWSSGQGLKRSKIKMLGYGTSLSLRVNTSSKYKTSHSVHNGVVEFSIGNKQN